MKTNSLPRYKASHNCLKWVSSSGQEPSQREIQELHSKQGFILNPELSERRKKFILTFDLNGFINVPDFLSGTVISRRIFIRMLSDTVDVCNYIEQNRLAKDHLIWDPKFVYLNQNSGRLEFVYIPFQPYSLERDLKSFVTDLFKLANFDLSEKIDYRKELLEITDSETGLSSYRLEEYIQKYTVSEDVIPDSDRIIDDDSKSLVLKLLRISENTITEISHFPFRIGRQEESVDLSIEKNTISRVHAEIDRSEEGFSIIDINSSNGTKINGEKIPAHVKKPIKDGDIIALADELFSVSIE